MPHHFTVQNNQQHEWLRFSNLVANTGQGDLRLRPEHDTTTTTFCLIDWIKLDGNSTTTERNYWDCFPDAVQGISAGWGDQYHHQLEGQELEITGAKPGIYYLLSKANPDGNFLETTMTNNTARTSFRITRDSKGNPKITEVSHSPCSGTLCGEDLPS